MATWYAQNVSPAAWHAGSGTSSNWFSATSGGTAATLPLSATDIFDTYGKSFTTTADILAAWIINSNATVGKITLSNNLDAQKVQDTSLEVSSAVTVTISVGKAEGGGTASSTNGLRMTKGTVSALTINSSSAVVTLYGDITITSPGSGVSGIKYSAAGKIAIFVGDIYMIPATMSTTAGIYGYSGATLDIWYGSVFCTGTSYAAYGVYLNGMTIDKWVGNITLTGGQSHYGIYAYSGAINQLWANINVACGTGIYLSNVSIHRFCGDIYITGDSIVTGIYLSSSAYIDQWYGDINITSTGSVSVYGVQVSSGCGISYWFGDLCYNGSSSSCYMLYLCGGSISTWIGDLRMTGSAGYGVYLTYSGQAISTWYGNVLCQGGTALYLMNGYISSWWGDMSVSGSGIGISKSTGYISNWYYHQDNNGYTTSNTGGTTLTKQAIADLTSLFSMMKYYRQNDMPIWPDTYGGLVVSSNVLSGVARFTGDMSSGYLTLPTANNVLTVNGAFGVSGNGSTPTATVPLATKVLTGAGLYGVGGNALTPSLTLPTGNNVLTVNGAFGVSGNGSTPSATIPAANNVLSGSGNYGVGGNGSTPSLTLPTGNNVLTVNGTFGVSGTGSTPTATIPAATNVLSGSGNYGVGGNSSTPSLTIPPGSNVLTTNGTYGASGNGSTPTYTPIAQADARLKALPYYGASGALNGTCVVPIATVVLAGIPVDVSPGAGTMSVLTSADIKGAVNAAINEAISSDIAVALPTSLAGIARTLNSMIEVVS